MTTPSERTRAVIDVGQGVMKLAPYLHGKSPTVRVSRELLGELHALLRHYPTPSEIWQTAEKCPELWEK